MKRIIFIVIVCVIIGLSACGDEVQDMEVVQSRGISIGRGVIEDITVILHQKQEDNFEECAREIIERTVKNNFCGIIFSWDIHGYPLELTATVYLSEADKKEGSVLFEMEYRQNDTEYQYNISDNPEYFQLEIHEG